MPIEVKISKSTNKNKKLMAQFYEPNTSKPFKTTHFGAAGYTDYIKSKDKERRKRYLDRHRDKENWNDKFSAGALSRYILWGTTTNLKNNINIYANKFRLKVKK
tara:strand:- start:3191 stop:3502 length:312 start_codon:yes stop_codon:yes gene_type:complete